MHFCKAEIQQLNLNLATAVAEKQVAESTLMDAKGLGHAALVRLSGKRGHQLRVVICCDSGNVMLVADFLDPE